MLILVADVYMWFTDLNKGMLNYQQKISQQDITGMLVFLHDKRHSWACGTSHRTTAARGRRCSAAGSATWVF